jgi:hypothetical protein
MPSDAVLAEKHVEDAKARVASSRERLQQESTENRRAYERFYNNLALFSGGTVALSVTYLGYLKSLSKPPAHPTWLIESWGCLLFCLAISLFWTVFYSHYMYYACVRQHMENMKLKRAAESDAVGSLDFVNLTPADRPAVEARLRKAAAGYDKDEKRAARQESFYFFLWKWSGRLARLAFLVGLGLLFCFAIRNV